MRPAEIPVESVERAWWQRAVFSWESAVRIAPDQLAAVEIPAAINEIQRITFAVISTSRNQDEAAGLAEFVAGPEGRQALCRNGAPRSRLSSRQPTGGTAGRLRDKRKG